MNHRLSVVCLVAITVATAVTVSVAQPRPPRGDRPMPPGDREMRPRLEPGLKVNSADAFQGYTLLAPQRSTTTYLINMNGDVVHQWPSKQTPGEAVYLLDDGSILRCERAPGNNDFRGGGIGGRVVRVAADGKLMWEYELATAKQCLHHDIEPMPNGNILMIAWEKKSQEEVLAAGREPELAKGDWLWPDCVLEIQPEGTHGGKIVWEWHVWDHLVQNHDKSKPNYGKIEDHPERVDLNYNHEMRISRRDTDRMRHTGYLGGDDDEDDDDDATEPSDKAGDAPERGIGPRDFGGGGEMWADWCHTNAIAYNAKLDQIALSVHNFHEIWIIDHSTSTKEAAGSTGGRQGKGGDLLYRWGNPRTYGVGDARRQQLFGQHDVRWIPEGYPGAGHLMVFNNGQGRRDGAYSSVEELVTPVDAKGSYALKSGKQYDPIEANWKYTAPSKSDFYASHISGAERLPNGNTLICDGEQARLFEVTKDGRIVWEFVSGLDADRGGDGDRRGPPGGPRGFRDGPPEGDRPDARRDDDRPRPRRDGERPDARPDGDRDGPRGGDGPGDRGDRGERRGRRGPGGPGGGNGMFRATRLGMDHPGVKRALKASAAAAKTSEKSKNAEGE